MFLLVLSSAVSGSGQAMIRFAGLSGAVVLVVVVVVVVVVVLVLVLHV